MNLDYAWKRAQAHLCSQYGKHGQTHPIYYTMSVASGDADDDDDDNNDDDDKLPTRMIYSNCLT